MHRTRVALLASLMVALTVAAGQALAAVPNVELVTFLVFVSGFLLGTRLGVIVGGCAMGIHSTFNVMGAPMPPVLAAQVACYALVGAAGGLLGPLLQRIPGAIGSVIAFAVCGAALTLLYQFVVSLTTFYVFTSDMGLWAYIWGGIVFSAVQIGWNTALFGVTGRATLAVLQRHREVLAH